MAAPKRTDEDTIRLAIVQRLPWIKRQWEQLLKAERQTKREMLSGETHYVWGQRHRLNVSRTSGHYSVETKGDILWVVTPADTDIDARRATLDRWYSRELNAALPSLLEK